MRKCFSILGFLVASSFAFTTSDPTTQKVMNVAEKNLSVWLAKIPVGQETNFGFLNRGEFAASKIGNPYQTITFNSEFYSDVKLLDKNYIQLQNEWRVPVTVNGLNRVLLTVNEKESEFTVNDIGGTGLAQEIQSKLISTEGNNYILRIYPLVIDIFVHTDFGQTISEGTFIPSSASTISIPALNAKKSFSQSEILKIIKTKLDQSKN